MGKRTRGKRTSEQTRPPAARGPEVVLVLDRGNAEFLIPRGWIVKPDPAGHLKIVDPKDLCSIEVSLISLPVGLAGLPTVEEMLRHTIDTTPAAREASPIEVVERGRLRLAWSTYPFECFDTDEKKTRRALGRWILAANGVFQVVMTCNWWEDDASWALPVIERVAETLDLGDGRQLASPAEHWAMREKN